MNDSDGCPSNIVNIPSATPPFSLSKPTIIPAVAKIPAPCTFAMDSVRLRIAFTFSWLKSASRDRGLNAKKHQREIGLRHEGQQLEVITEIDRGLSKKLERISSLLLPCFQKRQKLLEVAFLLPMKLSSTKSTWPR